MSDDYDVIIVGGGTSGMTAAMFAARRGARVLVVEASERLGGSLNVSTGQLSAAGTKLQAAKGIVDSPADHFDDIMRISKGTADPVLVRLAVDNAAETVDWLCESGLEFWPDHPVTGQGHEPYRVARYYWAPEWGRSILKVLQRCYDQWPSAGRLTTRLRTTVTGLVQDAPGDRVRGVRVRAADADTDADIDTSADADEYTATNVVLASGGYNNNPELFERLSGFPSYWGLSYPSNLGAGIELGLAAGASVRGRQNYLPSFGLVLDSDGPRAPLLCRPIHDPAVRAPWEIYVNTLGRRFVAEDEPSVDAREHALLGQPLLRRFIVFDARILRESPPLITDWDASALLRRFNQHPMFTSASTLTDLAVAAGIDADGLLATVSAYNEGLDRPDPFGRVFRPAPIAEPPFYSVRVQGGSVTSTVGLAVDGRLRVLSAGGEPIDGLFACGELLGSGQLMGNAVSGGMMATPALTFGRLLGQELLQWPSR